MAGESLIRPVLLPEDDTPEWRALVRAAQEDADLIAREMWLPRVERAMVEVIVTAVLGALGGEDRGDG